MKTSDHLCDSLPPVQSSLIGASRRGFHRAILWFLLALCIALPSWPAAAQLPGIPEPGVTIYGQVRNRSDGSPVVIQTVAWQVSDGKGGIVGLNASSPPPAKIITVDGQSYYIARIPFNTLSAGGHRRCNSHSPPIHSN
jgi:hypothetical protein